MIRENCKDVFTDLVLERFLKAFGNVDLISDNLEWLVDLLPCSESSVTQTELEIEVLSRLKSSFVSVRAFHACCPTDVSCYYEKGLIPLCRADAHEIFKTTLLSNENLDVTENDIDKVIEMAPDLAEESKVWFNLDNRTLLDYCGHYLLYGSEYIVGLAAKLSSHSSFDCRQYFKNRGTPTMFVCDLSWEIIREATAQYLIRRVIFEYFRSVQEQSYTVGTIDFGFSISSVVPSQMITSHYHPPAVFDPLTKDLWNANIS